MDKKSKKSSSTPQYKLLHQKLCVTSINFQRRALTGTTVLHLSLARHDIKQVRINCQQTRIVESRCTVNGVVSPNVLYQDPCLDLTQGCLKTRNLEFLTQRHIVAVESVDAQQGKGELIIDIPNEVQKTLRDNNNQIKIGLHFTLENPQGGIHFVIHSKSDQKEHNLDHMYTAGHHNSARLWFPCVDTYTEPCTWELEFTVDESMTAVSCGDLKETVYTADRRRKTFYYTLDIPTAAPNICLAVGTFEILVDPNMYEVTHFCLPQLKPLLEHSTATLHHVFEFIEELLNFRFPYACYKQVFVYESYLDACAYSSVGVFDTSLLHTQIIIDQTLKSRQCMARALVEQLFGCFMVSESWNDYWVVAGISGYLYGLWLKKTFGNSEYRHWLSREMELLCDYELETGPLILHVAKNKNQQAPNNERYFSHRSPHTVPRNHYEMIGRKAHLIMRKVETRIGPQLLLQALNKLLTLAHNAATNKGHRAQHGAMMLSTASFMRSIFTVSGKDLDSVIDDWITRGGVVCFDSTFNFNRKRNTVEITLKQSLASKGAIQYVGPLTVRLQELDGTFDHKINVEENVIKHDIPCHSKSRRNKKKKIPLLNGDEADMDLAGMDADSPVLWIRIDPELNILRKVCHNQPDFMWQFQSKYERDIVGQIEAIRALREHTTPAACLTLMDIVECENYFYKVRTEACDCLYRVSNKMPPSTCSESSKMIDLFRLFFCCETTPPVIRLNRFDNLQHYFLQRGLLIAISQLRAPDGSIPPDVRNFILDVIKLNDNSANRFSDNYYRATLVDCLSNMITPSRTATNRFVADDLSPEVRTILDEITRFLNLEKQLPSYHNTVTVSCLRALRKLQRLGHLKADSDLFKRYAAPGHFQDVRLAAIECLVDLLKTTSDWPLMRWLLEHVKKDRMPRVRMGVLRSLIDNPPFRSEQQHQQATFNLAEVVEDLWALINKETCHDAALRCEAIKLFHILFGSGRPLCLPAPQFGVVVNLKEKKISVKKEPQQQQLPTTTIRHVGGDLKRRLPPPAPPTSHHHHHHQHHDTNGLRMKIKLSESKHFEEDDVMAAESLLSLSNPDMVASSRPSTPGSAIVRDHHHHHHRRPSFAGDDYGSSAGGHHHHHHQSTSHYGGVSLLKEKKKKKKKHKHKSKHHHHHRQNESDWSSPATPASSANSP